MREQSDKAPADNKLRRLRARRNWLLHYSRITDNPFDIFDMWARYKASSIRTTLSSTDPEVALMVALAKDSLSGIGLAQHHLYSRLDEISRRQENMELLLRHSVQPVLQNLARNTEWEQRDPIPAAASAEYEWNVNVKSALAFVDQMLDDFDDVPSRLSFHIKIINAVGELLKRSRNLNRRYLRSAVLTVHDALRSVYSEDLTLQQVEALKYAFTSLIDVDWKLDTVRELDCLLIKNGFETVPSDRFMNSQDV